MAMRVRGSSATRSWVTLSKVAQLLFAAGLASCSNSQSRTITTEGRGAIVVGSLVCRDRCDLPAGQLSAQALPDEGNEFLGWKGCPLESPCPGESTTAAFTTRYKRAAHASEGGTLRASSPSSSQAGRDVVIWSDESEAVVVTAVPDTGWLFSGWSEPCSIEPSCTISSPEDTLLSAKFSKVVQLSTAGPGEIAIVGGPRCKMCQATAGQVIRPEPSINAQFRGFDVGCGNPCLLTNQMSNVVATFEHVATVTRLGDGDAVVLGDLQSCGAQECTFAFTDGQSLTLEATTTGDSLFREWRGCSSYSGNRCIVESGRRIELLVESRLAESRPTLDRARLIDCGGRAYSAESVSDAGILVTELATGAAREFRPSMPFTSVDCHDGVALLQFNRVGGGPVLGLSPSGLGSNDVVLAWLPLDGGSPTVQSFGSGGDDYAISAVLASPEEAILPIQLGSATSVGPAGTWGLVVRSDGGVRATIGFGSGAGRVFASTNATGDFAFAGTYQGAIDLCGATSTNSQPAPFLVLLDSEARCRRAEAGQSTRPASVRSLAPRLGYREQVAIVVLSEGSLSFGATQVGGTKDRYHVGVVGQSSWDLSTVEPIGPCLNAGTELLSASRIATTVDGTVFAGALSCRVGFNRVGLDPRSVRSPLLLVNGRAPTAIMPVGEGIFFDVVWTPTRLYTSVTTTSGISFGTRQVGLGNSIVVIRL
jgi:hypothetical protein